MSQLVWRYTAQSCELVSYQLHVTSHGLLPFARDATAEVRKELAREIQ